MSETTITVNVRNDVYEELRDIARQQRLDVATVAYGLMLQDLLFQSELVGDERIGGVAFGALYELQQRCGIEAQHRTFELRVVGHDVPGKQERTHGKATT